MVKVNIPACYVPLGEKNVIKAIDDFKTFGSMVVILDDCGGNCFPDL